MATNGVSAQVIVTEPVENASFAEADGTRAWHRDDNFSTGAAFWSQLSHSAQPGSLVLLNSYSGPLSGPGRTPVLQCKTDIVAGGLYTAQAFWNAPSGQSLLPGGGSAGITLQFFGGDACLQYLSPASGSSSPSFGPAGNGGWQLLDSQVLQAPDGARSALLGLAHYRAANQPAGASYVAFDDIALIGPHRFVKGSFLNRGETDLLLRNTATGEHRVWFMNDERRAGEAAISPTPSLSVQAVGVDDFNGDRKNDLLMWQPSSGALDLWLLNGITRVGSAIPIQPDHPGLAWKPSASADFNADGKPDIVLRDPVSQQIRIWTMNGFNHVGDITPTPSQAVNANWEIVGASDLDGDGYTDFLWYNATSGRIVYWLMDASVVRTSGDFTSPPAAGNNNWKVLAMGDYGIGPDTSLQGQPGTRDLVWRNAASGRLVIWYMDWRSGSRTSGTFTDPPDLPSPVTDWTVAGPR